MMLKKCLDVLKRNKISVGITALCAVIIIVMIVFMIPEKEEPTAPIENIRVDVYNRGIEVCRELSANDSMVEFARLYVSGADISSNVLFQKMQALEDECETYPEEFFFSAISSVVGINLDAASLYAEQEFEKAQKCNEKSLELFEELKLAKSIDDLDKIIKQANEFEI